MNTVLEQIKKLIDQNDTISFDIFDTLLLRNIYKPTDIFKILDKEVSEKYNIDNFYQKRIDAEAESRTKVEIGESNFDEIYASFDSSISKKILNEIQKRELELEEEFLVSNPFMQEVYEYAVKKKKKIVLISDMYLTQKFIKKILEKNNYDVKKIYISCEYRKNKYSGSLFELVKEKENIDISKWLHIGDNIKSDYDVPISLGINAYNYRGVYSYSNIEPKSITESIVLGIQNNFAYGHLNVDFWSKFGYIYISPIYYGFTKWLYMLTKDKDNVVFLSRDGYIIEKIYKKFPNVTDKFIKYIYCSRKATQLPAMIDGKRSDLIELLAGVNALEQSKVTINNIMEKVQLDITNSKYIEAFKLYGYTDFDKELDKNDYNQILKIISNFYSDIKKFYLPKRKLAIDYLKQEGLDKFDTLNIVDIGWGQSIQYAIESLLEKDVCGYYFGTIDSGKNDAFSKTFGYYFDLGKPKKNKETIMKQVMMFELIFSAPHGTCFEYKKEGSKIIPCLKELDNCLPSIEKFQNAALNIIDEYLKYDKYFDALDKEFCLKNYIDFLDRYDYDALNEFSKLSNDFLISSDKQYSYVYTVTKEEFKNKISECKKKAQKSLWNGALLISDIDEAEYSKYVKKVKSVSKNNNYREMFRKFVPLSVRKKLKKLISK